MYGHVTLSDLSRRLAAMHPEEERFEDPPPPSHADEQAPDPRLARVWNTYLLDDEGADSVVRVPTWMFDRLRRLTDGTHAYFVKRGLALLIETLEDEQARHVPGSQSPPREPFRAPHVESPVPVDEIRAIAQRFQKGPEEAVAAA